VAESDLGEVMRFLRMVFGVSENHRMFQEDVLRWKCFTPHPFWEGSRGYALRYKGEIAAFGCLMPCRFLTGSGIVTSCNVIDWAASKAVPSAGILLYKDIQGLAGTMINIGGTDDARAVLPRIGFQPRVEIRHYSRVVRPWLHFRQAVQDWKTPLRMARDYRELMRGRYKAVKAVTSRRLERFDGLIGELFPDPAVAQQVVCARTPEILSYFAGCPAARLDVYLLELDRTAAGYFLLSRVHGECRIADLWIRSADPDTWTAAYAAATAVAGKDSNVAQITAAASMPLQTAALESAGYRCTHAEPVFVLDPDGRLGGRNDLAVGLLENDGYYWSS
jgi:hypothetical protein